MVALVEKMMKRRKKLRSFTALGLLFCLLNNEIVSSFTPLDASKMTAQVQIGNGVHFQGPSSFQISSASANLRWFPRDSYLQTVKDFQVLGGYANCQIQTKDSNSFDQLGDENHPESKLQLEWNQPGNSASFTIAALVETKKEMVPVCHAVPFPLRMVLPEDIYEFLQPGQIANHFDPSIQQMAWEIVRDHTDMYHALFALADWTNRNIEYSLDSLGEGNVQMASSVLNNRWGKCDELSSLLVSMARAVGIPSRFVHGYAYTNKPEWFDNEAWGAHTWSEHYFPGVGWVPFDVTYGEYGYLNAGHVMLSVSQDAMDQSTIGFQAHGTGAFQLVTQDLEIQVTPTEQSPSTTEKSAEAQEDTSSFREMPFGASARRNGRTINHHNGHSQDVDQVLDVSLDAPYSTVGFGSKIALVATVTNHQDHYVSTTLEFTNITDASLIPWADDYGNSFSTTSLSNPILLNPYETKTVPFLVEINPKILQHRYTYTFPFCVSALGWKTQAGGQGEHVITVKEDAPVLGPNDFLQYYLDGY